MPARHTLLLFFTAAMVLLLTPGPAVLFVVTQSIQQGRKAGLVSALGLCCGGLVHLLAAITGLSAILASSAVAFHSVKLAGAGYLIFLGAKALRGRPLEAIHIVSPALPLKQHFFDGFVVNILNPKPAIFFLAFLPQFVDPAVGPIRFQITLLGATFLSLALITDGAYAIVTASGRSWLLRNRKLLRYERYISAMVFFGLGLSAALAGRRHN